MNEVLKTAMATIGIIGTKKDRILRKIAALILFTMYVTTTYASTDGNNPFPDWRIERTEQNHSLAGKDSLTITNPFGDVRVRTSIDDRLSVFAVIQRHEKDSNEPQLRFDTSDRAAILSVSYPETTTAFAPAVQASLTKRRVDIALFVPKTVALKIVTVDGLVQVKGHRGSVDAQTTSGDISIHSWGTISTQTVSGSTQLVLRNASPAEPSSAQSRTGEINVLLMEEAALQVKMKTTGSITTDYSVEIDNFPGTARKEAVANIGEASAFLELISGSGAITISRNFAMIQTSEEEAAVQENSLELAQ